MTVRSVRSKSLPLLDAKVACVNDSCVEIIGPRSVDDSCQALSFCWKRKISSPCLFR